MAEVLQPAPWSACLLLPIRVIAADTSGFFMQRGQGVESGHAKSAQALVCLAQFVGSGACPECGAESGPARPVTQANFDRIQEGMSVGEIRDMLGAPNFHCWDWNDGPNSISVCFDDQGLVKGKRIHLATTRETLPRAKAGYGVPIKESLMSIPLACFSARLRTFFQECHRLPSVWQATLGVCLFRHMAMGALPVL
ncbi:MAG TPA: hypothetical protein VG099_09590, partial [Gemmataceae bacterium]|nr:hypothetical protein [Gemmataceae bacterium]